VQERDPQRLLRPLTKLLQERKVSVQHAVFVPPDSSYSSLGPRTDAPDLSWQEAMQHVWDSELGPSLNQVCALRVFCIILAFATGRMTFKTTWVHR